MCRTLESCCLSSPSTFDSFCTCMICARANQLMLFDVAVNPARHLNSVPEILNKISDSMLVGCCGYSMHLQVPLTGVKSERLENASMSLILISIVELYTNFQQYSGAVHHFVCQRSRFLSKRQQGEICSHDLLAFSLDWENWGFDCACQAVLLLWQMKQERKIKADSVIFTSQMIDHLYAARQSTTSIVSSWQQFLTHVMFLVHEAIFQTMSMSTQICDWCRSKVTIFRDIRSNTWCVEIGCVHFRRLLTSSHLICRHIDNWSWSWSWLRWCQGSSKI